MILSQGVEVFVKWSELGRQDGQRWVDEQKCTNRNARIEMTQFVFVAIALLGACLALVLAHTFLGVISDVLQSRFATKKRLAAIHECDLAISNKRRRAQIDLSLSRRRSAWRQVLVVKVVQESQDVRSFYLVDKDYEPLPASLPGQHILIERPSAELRSHSPSRCYSLSDDCTAGHWRISVKKSSEHPTSVSRWLHEEVAAGDFLKVRGPSGAFYLQTDPGRCAVLVSAGIGITPMMPMLMESVRLPIRSLHCFVQYRDVAHMPFADSLLSVASQHPEIAMSLWISRFPKGVRPSSNGLFREGKFSAKELLAHAGAVHSSDYYLCGPEAWQSRLQKELIEAGVPPHFVRFELFQPSEKVISEVQIREHDIRFERSGSVARFEKSHATLLGCADKNKVVMDSGCRTGACGSCAVKLLLGKVRYTREPQYQLNSDEILPCVCIPETDLVVDA